jgi:hypothetical protein
VAVLPAALINGAVPSNNITSGRLRETNLTVSVFCFIFFILLLFAGINKPAGLHSA